MAEDDVDFRSLLHKENGLDVPKENHAPPTPTAIPPGVGVGGVAVVDNGCRLEDSAFCGGSAESAGVANAGGGRWDKSLGVLCQKFIMLFLITPVSPRDK